MALHWRENVVSGSEAILKSVDTDDYVNVSGSLYVSQSIYDTDESPGVDGQVLSSTVTGSQWIDISGAGEKGSQGETGEKGSQGETGEKGSQGETGEKGSQGETGEKGSQGETGEKGSQGETGEKGSQGTTGEKGSQGIEGTGLEGQKGSKGEPSTVQGEKGDKGAIGTTGAQGTDGSFGGASFDYTFSTSTTSGDPCPVFLRLDTTPQNPATELYID